MAIKYGQLPQYGYVDRYIAAKREGFGWDNLGARNIKFITLHRMVGTLQGTDSYFRNPAISSYTDFGIAIKASDPTIPGYIYLWNYPDGHRAPWASGPVSAPYGDGAAIVQKYGINAVNRDGISLEIGGTNEVIDDFSWREIVHFIAYWADRCHVPHTSFPLNPATGVSFLVWHQEFTIGTGKKCPFQWLMDNTGRLITDVKAMLRQYQEGGVVEPPKVPPIPAETPDAPFAAVKGARVRAIKPVQAREAPSTSARVVMNLPTGAVGTVENPGTKTGNGITWFDFRGPGGTGWVPVADFERDIVILPDEPKQWLDPVPVVDLALIDPDKAGDLRLKNGVNFIPVFDEIEAIRQGKQRRFAIDGDNVDVIGPDYKPGDHLSAVYRFTNDAGTDYYYTANHARVLVADFKRIKD